MRPSVESIVFALGVVAARGSIVFVDLGSTHDLLYARMGQARPAFAAAEGMLVTLARGPMRRLARRLGLLLPNYARMDVPLVYAGRWVPGVPPSARRAAHLAAGLGELPAPAELEGSAEDAAVVVFTSGTTAEPKGVVHTRSSLAAAARGLLTAVPMAPGDRVVTEQIFLGLPALIGGATWQIPPEAKKDAAGFAAAASGAAVSFAVPADATALLDGVESGDIRGPLADVMLLGAAPVTSALLERAAALAPATRWMSVYGMTEILPVAIVDGADKVAYVNGGGDGDLVGRPLPGIAATLEPAAQVSEAVVDGAADELVLAGGQLMRGYLADLTAGCAPAASHRTGDLARIDADGRVVLLGRSRDMIIRGTVNIYPGLFEDRLARLDGVQAAALVGLPRVDGDEAVALAVVPSADAPTAWRVDASRERAVRRAIVDVLDYGALPDVIVFGPAIPRSGRNRKPDRTALRAHVVAAIGADAGDQLRLTAGSHA